MTDDPSTEPDILELLNQIESRLTPSTVRLVREFITVGESQLAVEWMADALGDADSVVTTAEWQEFLRLAEVLETRPHVERALARCQRA